jgi:hypothetical protein
VTRRISLGCALLVILLGACRQTLVLDDLSADGGRGGTGGTSVGPTDGSSSDGHCSGVRTQPIPYTADQPQVLVALDRSSAMNAPFGQAPSPTISGFALNAILSAIDNYGGTRDTRTEIQFAFLDFPDNGPDCNAAASCCSSDVTTSYQAFATAADPCDGGGGPGSCYSSPDRPIAAALSRAHDYFMFNSGSQHSNERYVLLITAGDPETTCSPNECTAAITNTAALTSLGVTTEVVQIGTGPACLTLLANAQPISPSPFYLASDQSGLATVINQIVQGVAQGACRLTLSQAPNSGQLVVYNNGVPVPPDSGTAGNGWTYGGDNNTPRVYLHGSLCTSFLQQNPNSAIALTISDACSSGHLGGNP